MAARAKRKEAFMMGGFDERFVGGLEGLRLAVGSKLEYRSPRFFADRPTRVSARWMFRRSHVRHHHMTHFSHNLHPSVQHSLASQVINHLHFHRDPSQHYTAQAFPLWLVIQPVFLSSCDTLPLLAYRPPGDARPQPPRASGCSTPPRHMTSSPRQLRLPSRPVEPTTRNP